MARSTTHARRILLVAPSVPSPSWGFGIRVYQLLRDLLNHHEVTVLAYASPEEAGNIAALQQLCPVFTVALPRPAGLRKRRAQLRSLLSPFPYHQQHGAAMQATIDRLVAEDRFDLIQIESAQMGRFDFGSSAVVVVDEHNIEYELLYRFFQAERSLLRKAFNLIEYLKFRRSEVACWKRVDGCVLTSDREEPTVHRLAPGTATAVVPNGVDLGFFQPIDAPRQVGSIVFTGAMHYRPNVDAAVYFVREILPLLLQECPDLLLSIVGPAPADEVKRLAGPHVQVTGFARDVRTYLAPASVVVAPLRMGGGTRLKVLEALAMGKALVSSSIGCEGLAVRDGEHLLIADDPPAFARAVLCLLADASLAAQLGHHGRALVEQVYGWPAVGHRLNAFHSRLLADRAATGGSDSAPAARQLAG
jgi:polysaccharide biosynthesis protein PslH